jgi:hypothetical protein
MTVCRLCDEGFALVCDMLFNSGEQTTVNPMTQGYFNYVEASTPSSLYSTGKHRTRRDPETGEVRLEGIEIGEREMEVHDARLVGGAEPPDRRPQRL